MELNSTFVTNVDKWHKNKSGLGFNLKITTNGKQIIPNYSNVEPRYQKALYNLTNEIVKDANDEGIKKEDIVSLLKENGQFVLVYFK